MAYNLQQLINRVSILKSNADKLITSINYRAEELGANGTNPHTVIYDIPSSLAISIEESIDDINKSLEFLKLKLDGITFGLGPTGYNSYITFGPTGTMGPWGP